MKKYTWEIIGTILIFFMLFIITVSCVSRQKGFTEQYGEVTAIENQLVCVTYKVLSLEDTYVTNCYLHEQEHWYNVGDIYPDEAKEIFEYY